MPRVQIGDLSQPEGYQVTARPNAVVANAAPAANPEDSSAFRLARALGAVSEHVIPMLEDSTKKDAEAYFNSKTVGEIGKAMKDGTLLPQNNPLYVGTIHNLYGQNMLQQHMRDTEAGIQSGNLHFNSQEELDAYIVKQRNDLLSEHPENKFLQAGYDKQFNAYRTQVLGKYAETSAKALIDNGEAQVTDALYNKTQSILNPNNKLSPEESAAEWMKSFDMMKSTVLFDPKARKDALYENAATIAKSGRVDIVNALLDHKTDNGLTVRAIIGAPHADSMVHAAQEVYDHNMRESQKAQIKAIQSYTEDNARKEISLKLSNGQGGFIPDTYNSITNTGEPKQEKTESLVKSILQDQTKDLSLPEQVDHYARNGVTNDQWSNIIGAGASNLYTVGLPYDGKNIGTLSDAGQQSFDLFRQIYSISPEYARRVVKGERDFNTLQTMDDLITFGWAADSSQAAAVMNNVSRAGISTADYSHLKQDVALAVEDYTSGWWSNKDRNTTALNSRVRRLAEIAVQSGRSPNAKEAVAATIAHIEATSIKFNKAVYSRDQLPMFPNAGTADFWMNMYAEDKINPVLKSINPRLSYSDFFLAPDGDGYTVTMKDSPAYLPDKNGNPVRFTKKDMESYAKGQFSNDTNERVSKLNYTYFYNKLNAQYRITTPTSSARFSPPVKAPVLPSYEDWKKNVRGKKTADGVPVENLNLSQFQEWMKNNSGK